MENSTSNLNYSNLEGQNIPVDPVCEDVIFENVQPPAQNPDSNGDDYRVELPEGVTIEPQHPAHTDLRIIAPNEAALLCYLKVSDEQGELLENYELKQRVKSIFQGDSDDVSQLDEAISVARDLGQAVNLLAATFEGHIAKYRILQGLIYLKIREIILKSGRKPRPFFRQTFGDTHYRSILVYMRLASIPKAVNYACLGMERLLQLARFVEKSQADDPIGDFIRAQNLIFSPAEDFSSDDFKLFIDIAIARRLLAENAIYGINEDILKALILNCLEIKGKLLAAIKAVREAGASPNDYLAQVIAKGGVVQVVKEHSVEQDLIKKLEALRIVTGKLLDDGALLEQVSGGTLHEIATTLEDLAQKLKAVKN